MVLHAVFPYHVLARSRPGRIVRSARRSADCPVRNAWLLCVGFLVALSCWAHAGRSYGQDGDLIDSEPFDIIVLKEGNGGTTMQVQPLDNRQQLAKGPPYPTIRARLTKNPDEQLEFQGGAIERIELFEYRVLEHAKQLTRSGKFDEAFEHVKFVQDNYPETLDLDRTVDELLLMEASSVYRDGDLARAAMLLDELYQRSPNMRGLDSGLARVLGAQFKTFLDQRNFSEARRLYERASRVYQPQLVANTDRWRAQLQAIAQRALASGQQDLDSGRLREAYLTSRLVLEIWPETPGADAFAATVTARYPLLRVGVLQDDRADAGTDRDTAFHWAARRTQRLRVRQLFELAGVGPDGGEYRCVVGNARIADSNRELMIDVNPGERSELTGVHVAQVLLQPTPVADTLGSTDWFRVLDRVSVPGLHGVKADLRRGHLRIASLLTVPLSRLGTPDLQSEWKPYHVESAPETAVPGGQSSDRTDLRFVLNPDYHLATATQPREIIERRFQSPQQALNALRQGEIDMIDRVFPADVQRVRRDNQLEVVSYRIPSTHILVPNHQRPHVGNRVFRRGLTYAIDRGKILRRELLAQAELPGCQLISGPFPAGIRSDDPLAYAYDFQIEPRPYDPRHAKTLLQLAQLEIAAVASKREEAAPVLGELVLVHPDGELARIACEEIAKDLRIVGLSVRLRALPAGEFMPQDPDWDLAYLDYVMAEPLSEAGRLLAADGLAASTNPHVNLALRQLDEAIGWTEVGERLRVVHQLTYDDTTIIPLWQLVDYQARRSGMGGLPSEPVTTYQDVEQWRLLTRSE